MVVSVQPIGDVAVLTVGARSVPAEADDLRTSAASQWLHGRAALVVDVAGAPPAAAVLPGVAESLLRALAEALRSGGGWPRREIHVAATDPGVHAALTRHGLSRFLPVHQARALAVAAALRDSAHRWWYRDLPPTPAGPALLRHELDRLCRAADLIDLIPDAALVLSELTTNAVLHAVGPITASVGTSPDRLVLAVTDLHPPGPPRAPWPLLSEHGRGLVLVDAIADSWGVRNIFEGGKTTWAALTRAASGGAPSSSTAG